MKALRFLDENIEKMLCVIALALMSAVIVAQVFCRYVLNSSLSWSEELARYLFIWMIYIGISYGVKLDKHICVDAVYTFAPKSIKRYYAIVGVSAVPALRRRHGVLRHPGCRHADCQRPGLPRHGRSHAVRVCGACRWLRAHCDPSGPESYRGHQSPRVGIRKEPKEK